MMTTAKSLKNLYTNIFSARHIIRLCSRFSSSDSVKLPRINIHKERKEVEVVLPGYGFGDLNRCGNVNMWKVARMSEAVRILLYTGGDPTASALTNFMNNEVHSKLLFLGGARYILTPDFYDQQHFYNPLRHVFQLTKYRNSSYHHSINTYSTVTNKLVTSDSLFTVIVDLDSHRPTAIPTELKTLLSSKGAIEVGVSLDLIEPPVKPEKTLCFPHKVQWSNVDYYGHVNQSEYFKFVYDAALYFSEKRYLKSIRGDFAMLKVRLLEVLYKGEAKPGEDINVHVWEGNHKDHDGGHLEFQIENLNSEALFQGRMVIYDEQLFE